MTASPGIEPGPHWWEVTDLTTAPSLLPQKYLEHPLQLTVTWYKIRHAGDQTTHLDIQNKENSSLTG